MDMSRCWKLLWAAFLCLPLGRLVTTYQWIARSKGVYVLLFVVDVIRCTSESYRGCWHSGVWSLCWVTSKWRGHVVTRSTIWGLVPAGLYTRSHPFPQNLGAVLPHFSLQYVWLHFKLCPSHRLRVYCDVLGVHLSSIYMSLSIPPQPHNLFLVEELVLIFAHLPSRLLCLLLIFFLTPCVG